MPTNKGGNDHDLDVFIMQYREYRAGIEKELECFETQNGILEKKLKLDLMLIDSREKAS